MRDRARRAGLAAWDARARANLVGTAEEHTNAIVDAALAVPVRTLGDIQTLVSKMRDDGITRASILYVVDRVYWDLDEGVYRDDPR